MQLCYTVFMTEAIITAAGASERMGSWKLMLPYKGKPVIDHVVEAVIPSADHIILVGGYNAEALFRHISKTFRDYLDIITPVNNEGYSRGMFSSIQTGISFLNGQNFLSGQKTSTSLAAHQDSRNRQGLGDSQDSQDSQAENEENEGNDFFIIHSDLPMIRSVHIKELFMIWDELQSNTDQYDILQPVYESIPGHPVIFKHHVIKTILEKRPSDSMNEVFADHQVYRVGVSDPAYATDIDTPEAYNRLP